MNTIRVSNSLDPDQDQPFVGPDLGHTVCKNYLQMTNFTAGMHIVLPSTL